VLIREDISKEQVTQPVVSPPPDGGQGLGSTTTPNNGQAGDVYPHVGMDSGAGASGHSGLTLRLTVPKGKVSSLMGVMNLLQSRIAAMQVTLHVEGGQLSEQDYEDKVMETFRQRGYYREAVERCRFLLINDRGVVLLMATPTVPTVKRLYALSANECAFPNCHNPLVDPASGTVTGRICHIKARSKDGPRYDPDQTEDERHAFENLVLMCPIHHDVIDADPDSFTVERLHQIKTTHEILHSGGQEPSDEAAEQFLENLNLIQITDGSMIYTVGQQGGQVAHSITNVAPQPTRELQVKAYATVVFWAQPMGEIVRTAALAVNIANVGSAPSYVGSIGFHFIIGDRVEKRTIFGPVMNFRNIEDYMLFTVNPKLPLKVDPGDSGEYHYRLAWLRDAFEELGSNQFPVEVEVKDRLDNVYTYLIPQETWDRLIEYGTQAP
jgi:hypothetical protein